MANEPETTGGAPLPPKLDLTRRFGARPPTPAAPVTASTTDPASQPPPQPAPTVSKPAEAEPAVAGVVPPHPAPQPVAAFATQIPAAMAKPVVLSHQPTPMAPVTKTTTVAQAPVIVSKSAAAMESSTTARLNMTPPVARPTQQADGTDTLKLKPPAPAAPVTATAGPITEKRTAVAPAAAAMSAGTTGPGTIKLQRPGQPTTPAPAAVAPAMDTRPAAKRETSRIPLEVATAMHAASAAAPGTAPKTIRIKSAGAVPGVIPNVLASPQPAPAAAPAPAAPGTGSSADKRKTSRISLESALVPETKVGEESPKTIKLKRPSEASTVKLAAPPAEAVAPSSQDAKSKTARLDDLPPAEEEISPTRKKTIKVKRPSGAPGAGVVELADEGGEGPAAAFHAAAMQAPPEDSPHWSFAIAAVTTLLLAIVTVWMLCAQVLGPDVCLTHLSYGAKTTDLPWPGKVTPSR